MKQIKATLVLEHQEAATNARNIANILIRKLLEDSSKEEDFLKAIQVSSKASLALQRLCSTLANLISMDHALLERQIELSESTARNNQINRHDCELVIGLARNWGLLKENCDEQIDKIIEQYENNERGNHE
ncbi:MAG: hypothetical protein LW825_05850 [Candidatus Jidaibacter sp.]|jgi:hypothetical protein|nr:hypothetical protein [Candidatus Jidaibacter sp.]